MRLAALVCIIALTMVSAYQRVHAQIVQPLEECGWVHGQTSSNQDDARRYEFEILEDGVGEIMLRMHRATGTLDPFLMLLDSYGNLVATDDNSDGNWNARIAFGSFFGASEESLPAGRYFVVATARSGTGKFILYFDPVCGAGPSADGACNGAEIVNTVIRNPQPGDNLPVQLQGTEGQIVEVEVRRGSSGRLIPRIRLAYNPNFGDTPPNPDTQTKSSTGSRVVLKAQLKFDGQYEIAVSGLRGTSGEFVLTCLTR